jgi:dipeptidyl aminopeptidase/acylaminoacyl peptidase
VEVMQKHVTDGTIVSEAVIPPHDHFKEIVDISRIEYLIDELRVVGFIIKPKNIQDQKLPVLIYNRGGNREYGKIDDERLYRLSSYASLNYIVLATQYRGNDGGEGREEFGGSDVRDVFAMSWLADTLPYADITKKVMVGHSRGGLMTYICIKMGIDIKAAAVIGAPTNLFRRPLPFPMEEIHAELIGNPIENQEEYRDRSAIFWAERLTRVPILILHGDADSRVDPDDAKELAQLLERNQAAYNYIPFPEGNHALSNFEHERDDEIFKWFELYL